MKLNIRNKDEAERVIDQFGGNQQKIKALQDENKKLKALYEAWANENPELAFEGETMEGQTGKFVYAMALGNPALKVQSHLTEEEVVGRLKANEETAEYVRETFDSDALKADYGRTRDGRRAVEDFGLYFTTPKPHLVVEAL